MPTPEEREWKEQQEKVEKAQEIMIGLVVNLEKQNELLEKNYESQQELIEVLDSLGAILYKWDVVMTNLSQRAIENVESTSPWLKVLNSVVKEVSAQLSQEEKE